MTAAVLPMRGMAPGLTTLLLQVATGALVYGGVAAAFDLAGLRSLALAHLDVPGDMQGDGAGLVKAWRVEEAAGAAQVDVLAAARVSDPRSA